MKNFLSSKAFHSILGFGVSAALVLWMVQEIDWSVAWKESRSMHIWPMLPMLLVTGLHYSLRSLRWRYLLNDGTKIPFALLFDSIMIGNLATFVLPLRAGEFIRPYVLQKEAPAPVSFPAAFTSVVIERFFDLAVVLGTFALVLFYIPAVPDWVHAGAWGLSMLGLGIFLFIIGGILLPALLMRCMKFCLYPFPEAVSRIFLNIASELIAGAHVLKSPKNLCFVTLLSLLVWLSNYCLFYVCFFLVDVPGTMLVATTTAVIVALAVAAPSAPGFVGVIQVGCIAGFALFGISKELAIAYSVLSHIFQYLFVCATGGYALTRRNLSLAQLKRSRDVSSQT